MDEKDIIALVDHDEWMMAVLHEAARLKLPDWMIGAGFLRTKVWDHLHGIKREVADTSDIDLVYFDPEAVSEEKDRELSAQMSGICGLEWEIKNEAYMHTRHDHRPYKSTEEALSHWVETATAVAVTLRGGKVQLIAPHGIGDLVDLILRPTPGRDNLDTFHRRIKEKRWLEKWPKLKVVVE